MPKFTGQIREGSVPKQPGDYFWKTMTDTVLEEIVKESNVYAAHKNINNPLCLTKTELYNFLGIVFYMGAIKITQCRIGVLRFD